MPTIELLAEVQIWRERAEKAEADKEWWRLCYAEIGEKWAKAEAELASYKEARCTCSLCGGPLNMLCGVVEPCPKCLDTLYLRSARPNPDPLSRGGGE